MVKWISIRKWFAEYPHLEDPVIASRAKFLHNISLWFSSIEIIYALFQLVILGDMRRSILHLCVSVYLFVHFLFLKKGKINFSAHSICIMSWVTIFLLTLISNTIDALVFIYIIPIIMVSLLLDRRWGWIYSILTVVWNLIAFLLYQENILPIVNVLNFQSRNFLSAAMVTIIAVNIMLGITYHHLTNLYRGQIALSNKQQKLITQKNFLLQEIHHRVKNNLQIISSLLHIQSQAENIDLDEFILQTTSRINAIASVHEMIYTQESFDQFTSTSYIDTLIDKIRSVNLHQDVVFTTDIDECNISIDLAIPIGLILNEAIDNSLKHAFINNEQKNIRISLQTENEICRVEISDNGSGFNIEHVIKRNGIKIMDALVSQISGRLHINGSNGTTLELIIPTIIDKQI